MSKNVVKLHYVKYSHVFIFFHLNLVTKVHSELFKKEDKHLYRANTAKLHVINQLIRPTMLLRDTVK